MTDLQKTRFLAANYTNLQGLHAVPIGLLLVIVVLWANAQSGPASDLTLPLLAAGGMLILAWSIRRYYQAHFGAMISTTRQKKVEIWAGIIGGGIALAAYLADISMHLSFSCIGLVFAGAFITEYWRMQLAAPGRYLLANTLVYTAIMVITSLLPLLGFPNWWTSLGIHSQLMGVLIVAGGLVVIAGSLGHLYFVRQLHGEEA